MKCKGIVFVVVVIVPVERRNLFCNILLPVVAVVQIEQFCMWPDDA